MSQRSGIFLAVNLSPPGDGPMEGLRVESVLSLTDATSKAVRLRETCPDAAIIARIAASDSRVGTFGSLLSNDASICFRVQPDLVQNTHVASSRYSLGRHRALNLSRRDSSPASWSDLHVGHCTTVRLTFTNRDPTAFLQDTLLDLIESVSNHAGACLSISFSAG